MPSGSRINLLWTDNANNEDGFTLERADAGVGGGGPCGTFVTIQPSLPANTTGFNDTGLGANHWYCYRVRAFNGEVILLGRTHCQLGVTLSNEQRRSCVNWSPVDTGYLSTCTPCPASTRRGLWVIVSPRRRDFLSSIESAEKCS